MGEYPDYDRSETWYEMRRRSGKTLEKFQREARQRKEQMKADEEIEE